MTLAPGSALAGTGTLIRLALRRDRVSLPFWLVTPALMAFGTANAYQQLYPAGTDRAPLTETVGRNPALVAITGPAFDLTTPGGFTSWRILGFLGVVVALMAIFTVTRHTRAEEDTGRHELLAAGVVGRYAPLTAAVVVAGGASTAIGGLAALALAGSGLSVAGALAFGKALAGIGWVFTGIAAMAVQLGSYARTANTIASAILGASFLLRGLGDSTPEANWLSWLSPIGWAQQLRPFADERWWVLALPTLTAALTLAAGYSLLPRRDAGAGLLPDRLGPAQASPGLRSPFGLAWRLQKGSLIGWTVGMAIAGAAFGAVALGINDLLDDNPQMRAVFERMGGSTVLIDAFLAQIAGMFGMVTALYGVQSGLRMRAEETAVRLEPLLATSVSRLQWAASHLLFAMLGTGVVLTAAGIATGLTHGARAGDVTGVVGSMLGATLVQLPAIWLVVGTVVVLYGLFPRYTGAAWGVAAAFLFLALFGPILDLPQLARDASPFTHVPRLPAVDVTATPLLWLVVIAVAALAVGLNGFRRRDVG